MSERPPPKPTARTLLGVAAWGAITASVAYVISRGNISVFIIVMLAIGVAQRVIAVRIVQRRGEDAPEWWRI